LLLKGDRCEPIVALPLHLFTELAITAQRGRP
jgi:hypothetical protein